MVEYPAKEGKAASPVGCLLYVSIENKQSMSVTVEQYSLAVRRQRFGAQWEVLVPIPLDSSTLYILGIHDAFGSGFLKLPHGFYRVNAPMTLDDMAHAAPMSADQKLDEQLRNPIESGHLVNGWAAFDTRNHPAGKSFDGEFRINLRETDGGNFEVRVRMLADEGPPQGGSVDSNAGLLTRVGPVMNISSDHVKFYGDF